MAWPFRDGPAEARGGESLSPLDSLLAAAVVGRRVRALRAVAPFGLRHLLEKDAIERSQLSTSQNPGSWCPLQSSFVPSRCTCFDQVLGAAIPGFWRDPVKKSTRGNKPQPQISQLVWKPPLIHPGSFLRWLFGPLPGKSLSSPSTTGTSSS